MTFKIETIRSRNRTILKISGRLRRENLAELNKQMGTDPARTVLDVSEVTLVDLEVVRFLNACQEQGVECANPSPYIREWMNRERKLESQ
jgi:ABC-type transporter Mla MlaB component